MPTPTHVTYFKTAADLRTWFAANHGKAAELWVGFYKRGSGKPSITWPESVDEALCVGWIDGIRKSIDAERYAIRFTPRKKGSVWSAVNVKRMNELSADKRVRPPGAKAFAARVLNKSGTYSYEQRSAELEEPYASLLRKNAAASTFFAAQPPGYRKTVSWYILSAKKEETRLARLQKIIDLSAKGKRLL